MGCSQHQRLNELGLSPPTHQGLDGHSMDPDPHQRLGGHVMDRSPHQRLGGPGMGPDSHEGLGRLGLSPGPYQRRGVSRSDDQLPWTTSTRMNPFATLVDGSQMRPPGMRAVSPVAPLVGARRPWPRGGVYYPDTASPRSFGDHAADLSYFDLAGVRDGRRSGGPYGGATGFGQHPGDQGSGREELWGEQRSNTAWGGRGGRSALLRDWAQGMQPAVQRDCPSGPLLLSAPAATVPPQGGRKRQRPVKSKDRQHTDVASTLPCPNIDVRQIIQEQQERLQLESMEGGSRGGEEGRLVEDEGRRHGARFTSASFMDNPSAFLAEQTMLVNQSLPASFSALSPELSTPFPLGPSHMGGK